ncbi:MAG: hypothetical protein WAT43_19545 [Chitinophagales bacterium]|nr:hypothetical protein [Bacteroidota bacterium]
MSRHTLYMFMFLITITGVKSLKAQCGIYSEDFINTTKCKSFTSFESKIKTLGYSYFDEFSEVGVTLTYQCDIANEDSSRDMLNFSIGKDEYGDFTEVIFATNRYYTYDALSNGLFANAFRKDSVSTAEAGLTQTFYYSQLYPGFIMVTQIFNTPTADLNMQYYINLKYYWTL